LCKILASHGRALKSSPCLEVRLVIWWMGYQLVGYGEN